jgi:hypothetical protein
MLPEGFELWVRLPLLDGERIDPLLLAVIVLDVREVMALHPDLAQVPAGLFYEFPRLAFLSRRRRKFICYLLVKLLYPLQDRPILRGESFLP